MSETCNGHEIEVSPSRRVFLGKAEHEGQTIFVLRMENDEADPEHKTTLLTITEPTMRAIVRLGNDAINGRPRAMEFIFEVADKLAEGMGEHGEWKVWTQMKARARPAEMPAAGEE